MLNYIWGFIILISLVSAIFTGKINELSNSIMFGANSAIELIISLMGTMCFFSGIMKIADKSGLTKIIAKFFSPLLSKLFPGYQIDSPAFKAICMNITANLLGLGNAATPFGISAMKSMQKQNKDKKTACNNMIMFVVINTASIQIIPTLMSTLRYKYGSSDPFEILPAIWISSIFALLIGICATKILEKRDIKHE